MSMTLSFRLFNSFSVFFLGVSQPTVTTGVSLGLVQVDEHLGVALERQFPVTITHGDVAMRQEPNRLLGNKVNGSIRLGLLVKVSLHESSRVLRNDIDSRRLRG